MLQAADQFIPRRQDKPPGPPLSPAEAIKKMTVPEGFSVELVASEPDIVNPVAMAIDERGRFWITESLEYPRREPGPGRDRIKILEDTNGDGTCDKFTVFAEGLNIPSGIAVGHGGVWVANAPDLLFLQDTDGDGKADKQEVIVTGFGRDDTHELPNSLTWGPDGYLYGLNGVFNFSKVTYPKTSPNYKEGQKPWQFTCALFRIHPVQKTFEIFCEGTSNPWGVTWDSRGEAFISACVIDHLWHLTETGYYHRQGGPYPAFTWKLESIVKHKHQAAAYCGITYFDSDAYPLEYRGKLFMGNIHGGCINVDRLERDGSTYFAKPEPDFLTANDVWFMPVVQKVGPDGSLYVLDWYDRYHCYQDANADPKGIDRLHGRLYRVKYQGTKQPPKFDLAKETDEQLVERLKSPNVFYREHAQRILAERLYCDPQAPPSKPIQTSNSRPKLWDLVLAKDTPQKIRLPALWAIISAGHLDPDSFIKLLGSENADVRAWGVRSAGNQGFIREEEWQKIQALAGDESVDVRLQVAITAAKLKGIYADGKEQAVDPLPTLVAVLASCGEDKLIPHIVWQNLHPRLEQNAAQFVKLIGEKDRLQQKAVVDMLPRVIDRVVAVKTADPTGIAALFSLVTAPGSSSQAAAQQCLTVLAERVQSRELSGEQLQQLKPLLAEPLAKILAAEKNPLRFEAATLAASWQDKAALEIVRSVLQNDRAPEKSRQTAIEALVAAKDVAVLPQLRDMLAKPEATSTAFRGDLLSALGRFDSEDVGTLVVELLPQLSPDLQPRAIEVLTQRTAWGKKLLTAVAEKKIAPTLINANQARRLQDLGDAELTASLAKHWGTVRTGRDPKREEFINAMRQTIRGGKGDAATGQVVFKKVCGQCHKIYGEGQEVGPEITANGRSNFEQLLSNVFDPSLVIGASYQARTVATVDGRVLTGLLVEDSPQRIVLKMQGGKLETIARDDVEQLKVSELSMMPEGLEKQLQPQELVDLFAFLTLDKPPSDPNAQLIPGTREVKPRHEGDAKKFGEVIDAVLPGFRTEASGEGGIALLGEFRGRSLVLQTHPVDKQKPCVLTRTIDLPAGRKARLNLAVSHHPEGDWELIIRGNGEELLKETIGSKTTTNGWKEITVDLSKFSGKTLKLELENRANTSWAWEHGYWGGGDVVAE